MDDPPLFPLLLLRVITTFYMNCEFPRFQRDFLFCFALCFSFCGRFLYLSIVIFLRLQYDNNSAAAYFDKYLQFQIIIFIKVNVFVLFLYFGNII